MSNQPFLYDPTANVLRQRAEMHEPHPMYENLVIQYKKHLASLPGYTPVSGWVPEVGKEYVLNEHFSVKRLNPQFREDETYEEYLSAFEEGYRFQPYTKEWFMKYRDAKVAVPIEQNQDLTEKDFDDLTDLSRKERGPVFSLQDMIECWEAAEKYWCEVGRNAMKRESHPLKNLDKKQYFKTKFNINIDDLPGKGK